MKGGKNKANYLWQQNPQSNMNYNAVSSGLKWIEYEKVNAFQMCEIKFQVLKP